MFFYLGLNATPEKSLTEVKLFFSTGFEELKCSITLIPKFYCETIKIFSISKEVDI
jgi:hypothetical protein